MTLSEDQKAGISKWIEDGASLSEIQKRLKEEFQISVTYMEVRFLVDDLKLSLKDPEPPAEKPAPPVEEEAPPVPGKLNVTIDQITRPGAIISGRVVFSDGEKATWYLDQTGRLGLDSTTPGYRPGQEDIIGFQAELERLARSQGL